MGMHRGDKRGELSTTQGERTRRERTREGQRRLGRGAEDSGGGMESAHLRHRLGGGGSAASVVAAQARASAF